MDTHEKQIYFYFLYMVMLHMNGIVRVSLLISSKFYTHKFPTVRRKNT